MNTNNREQSQESKPFTVTPLKDLTATHSIKVGTDTSPAVSLTNSGSVTATGAITGSSVSTIGAITGGSVSTTGAMTGGSISTAGAVTGGSVSATGAITGGDITSSGNISTSNGVVTGKGIESTGEVAAAVSLRIGQTVLNEADLHKLVTLVNRGTIYIKPQNRGYYLVNQGGNYGDQPSPSAQFQPTNSGQDHDAQMRIVFNPGD